MRRFLVFTVGVVCAFAASPASAQSISLGVRAGVASATIDGFEDDVTIDRRTGMSIGAFAELGLGGMLSIQPEVLFTQKGMTLQDPDAEVGLTLSYAEVPVLAKLRMPMTGASPYLFLGPVFGMRTGCTGTFEAAGISGEVDCDQAGEQLQFEDFDVGLLVGVGAGMGVGPGEVSADLRYNAGLRSVSSVADEPEAKNRTFAIMLGYAITLGM